MNAYVAVKNYDLWKVVYINNLSLHIEAIVDAKEKDDYLIVNLLELSAEDVVNLKEGLANVNEYDCCVLEDNHLSFRQTRGEPIFRLETVVRY